MKNAMIVGTSGPCAESAIDGLWEAGYHSIVRVSDAQEGLLFVGHFAPDLIMVLPNSACADSMAELQELSEQAGAPILVATSDAEHALSCLGPGGALEGPWLLQHVEAARAAAVAPRMQLRAA